jgi:accessory gene regulator B
MRIGNFIESNTVVDESEKEIISFGLNMMITTTTALVVAIVISACLSMLIEGILLLVSIIILRQYAGGYHAKSQNVCAVISCVIYGICLLFIKHCKMNSIIQFVLCVLAILIVFFLAPVDNANNELTVSEKKFLRNKVRISLSLEVIVFVMLLISENIYWSEIVIVSIGIVATLVLIGFIQNKVRG